MLRTMRFPTTLCFSALFMPGCLADNGAPVKLVIPDQYQGPIWIIEDSAEGKTIEKQQDGYVYEISESGVLYVSSLEPFMEFHEERHVYSTGATVALHLGSMVSTKRDGKPFVAIMYFLGTEADAKKFALDPVFPDGSRNTPE